MREGVIRCSTTLLSEATAREPGMVERVQERMAEETRAWANRNGYDVIRVSWELEPPDEPELLPDDRPTPSWMFVHRLRMEAVCRARWDGVWGDLRAALDEDGLLPAHDRDSRPWPPTGLVGASFHIVSSPADIPHPSPGDYWFDPETELTRIWDGARWLVFMDPARPPPSTEPTDPS